jgi:hypothetical protein
MGRAGIRDADASALLGDVGSGLYAEMKQNPDGHVLQAETIRRISFMVGIYKALHVRHMQRLADEWMQLPNSNPIFGGKTPLEYMVGGGLPAMQVVRRHLDWQQ